MRRFSSRIAILLVAAVLAEGSPAFAQGSQPQRPIHDSLAAIASRPLPDRVRTFGLAQNAASVRHRHSATFPVKLGAGIGCAAGALLLLSAIEPGTAGPARQVAGAGVACAEFGLMGAGIGYIIAVLK